MLERAGQTEAAVDLARLAGLNPAGVICEVMNDDGTMARVDDLVGYCARHALKMITVADLIAYRRRHDKLVERVVSTRLPTGFGDFQAVGYRELIGGKHHVALVKGEVDGARRTCSCACTPSASPATCFTPCAATAASSSSPPWR